MSAPMQLIQKGKKPRSICREHGCAFTGKKCPQCKTPMELAREHAVRVMRYLDKHYPAKQA